MPSPEAKCQGERVARLELWLAFPETEIVVQPPSQKPLGDYDPSKRERKCQSSDGFRLCLNHLQPMQISNIKVERKISKKCVNTTPDRFWAAASS
jgi:hypothetical protein